jgi:thioredoxin
MFFSVLFIISGITLSAQTDKKPEMLTKETFMKKVWDYAKDTSEFVYLGDKPCIIDFYADWCGPCRKIAPYMEEFSKSYNDIYIYKINVDQQKELAALFQARNIPTVIFVPMKGQPTATKGAYPKEEYVKLIDKILLNKTMPSATQK